MPAPPIKREPTGRRLAPARGANNAELTGAVDTLQGLTNIELTGAVETVEGLTNADLAGAVEAVKGLTNTDLTEAVDSLPVIDSLCTQASTVTEGINDLGLGITGISVLGLGPLPQYLRPAGGARPLHLRGSLVTNSPWPNDDPRALSGARVVLVLRLLSVIDSHTHLFLCERPEAEVVAAAGEAGVVRMLNVGLDGDSSAAAIAAAGRHESVFATAGCHPTEAASFDLARADEIARLVAENEKVRAIGETGIDYYRETASRADQRRALEAQVEIARDRGLPVVIHARDPDGETGAVDDVFEILDARADGVAVILHCFLAPWRVEDAIERGWFCSFSGIVTFPSAEELREAAAKLPDELVLVETDAPYLAPQPVRGKPNEPAHVVSTAEVVAEVRGVSYAELERTVEANARALFGW